MRDRMGRLRYRLISDNVTSTWHQRVPWSSMGPCLPPSRWLTPRVCSADWIFFPHGEKLCQCHRHSCLRCKRRLMISPLIQEKEEETLTFPPIALLPLTYHLSSLPMCVWYEIGIQGCIGGGKDCRLENNLPLCLVMVMMISLHFRWLRRRRTIKCVLYDEKR